MVLPAVISILVSQLSVLPLCPMTVQFIPDLSVQELFNAGNSFVMILFTVLELNYG